MPFKIGNQSGPLPNLHYLQNNIFANRNLSFPWAKNNMASYPTCLYSNYKWRFC